MIDYLKELCCVNGVSGNEDNVRDYIINKINGKAEISVDNLGNVIAFVKGKYQRKQKVMFSAHLDEVGFIITAITDDGYLKFASVGGIDEKVVAGRNILVGENLINAVVCTKPIHLKDKNEREECPEIDKMYIDIGAKSKEEAEKYVSQGDFAFFKSDVVEFGNNLIKAKAIDDRFGCAVMLKMIENGVKYDTYFCFVVQEEVGLRGSGCVCYNIRPDYAIVLEATTASDISGSDEINCVCSLGKGAVVSFMDRATLYDRNLFNKSKEIAKNNNILWQTKSLIAGGNDAGAIHKSVNGIKTIAVSLPCRYIHSASCVADKNDMNSVYLLAEKLSESITDD